MGSEGHPLLEDLSALSAWPDTKSLPENKLVSIVDPMRTGTKCDAKVFSAFCDLAEKKYAADFLANVYGSVKLVNRKAQKVKLEFCESNAIVAALISEKPF